jgi:hypothetical protein
MGKRIVPVIDKVLLGEVHGAPPLAVVLTQHTL